MKLRYIVRTFVEAKTAQEAIRIARKTNPHEAYIDNEIWKQSEWMLKDKNFKAIGYK